MTQRIVPRGFIHAIRLVVLLSSCSALPGQACTTAVISGRATMDGRPILWKNRDTSQTHNELVILDDGPYRVLAVTNANKRNSVWMGVNSAGLCIENSLSKDLSNEKSGSVGMGNGQFMKHVLQHCATVAEVRQALEDSNSTGRQTRANFGVIDAQGGAAIFEAGPDSFAMFDANDPNVAPNGYLVRTNFAPSAHELPPNPSPSRVETLYSSQRYLHACRRLERPQGNKIDVNYVLRNLTRDLSDSNGNPIAGSVNGMPGQLPDDIVTAKTISRNTTVSAAVFHGVRPGEDPALTTMWTILGDPKFSIAVPGWACMETVADSLTDERGGELGEVAITLRGWATDEAEQKVETESLPGIWRDLWPVEDKMLEEVQTRSVAWRNSIPDVAEMSQLHREFAHLAMEAITRELEELKSSLLDKPGSVAQTFEPVRSADEWTEQERDIFVGLYDDVGSGRSKDTLMGKLRALDHVYVARLSAEEIRAGELHRFDVLIHPGGSGGAQGRELGKQGRTAIRAFVHSGGGYIGVCAGAYLASSHYDWSLGLLDARVFDTKHWARGTGQVDIRLSDAGRSVFGLDQDLVEIYYGQGPLLVPAGDPKLDDYQVLASYASEIAKKGAPMGAMQGTTAVALGTFGRGEVLCFSPHPELTPGLEEMVASAIRRVQRERTSAFRALTNQTESELSSRTGNGKSAALPSTITPDVSQKGMPNGNYCAPCAAANLLHQFAQRRLLSLPKEWMSSMNKEIAHDTEIDDQGGTDLQLRELVRVLGDARHMQTVNRNGTNRYRLVNGMSKWVQDQCNARLETQYLGIRPYDRRSLWDNPRTQTLAMVGIPQPHHVRRSLDAGLGTMILFGSYRRSSESSNKLERLGGHYVAVVGYGRDAEGQPDQSTFHWHDSNDSHQGIKYVRAESYGTSVELWQDDEQLAKSSRFVRLHNAPIRQDGRVAILETVFSFDIAK